jgi:hypothetical protein
MATIVPFPDPGANRDFRASKLPHVSENATDDMEDPGPSCKTPGFIHITHGVNVALLLQYSIIKSCIKDNPPRR